MTDYSENATDIELESLQAIYINELTYSRNSDGTVNKIELLLHPATGHDTTKQYVCMTLVFTLSSKYPDEPPGIEIRNPRGLGEEEISSLVEDMVLKADDMRGEAMLYTLIEMAKDSLTEGNIPHCPCVVCLEHFRRQDNFHRTACYHYFHNHCLYKYLLHTRAQLEQEENEAAERRHLEGSNSDKSKANKILCPVCRSALDDESLAVTCSQQDLEQDEKIEEFVIPPSLKEQQLKMAQLYEHQKSKGGIIDLEQEKNRYLVNPEDRMPLRTVAPVTASEETTSNSAKKHHAKDTSRDKTKGGAGQSFSSQQHRNKSSSRGRGYSQPGRYDQEWHSRNKNKPGSGPRADRGISVRDDNKDLKDKTKTDIRPDEEKNVRLDENEAEFQTERRLKGVDANIGSGRVVSAIREKDKGERYRSEDRWGADKFADDSTRGSRQHEFSGKETANQASRGKGQYECSGLFGESQHDEKGTTGSQGRGTYNRESNVKIGKPVRDTHLDDIKYTDSSRPRQQKHPQNENEKIDSRKERVEIRATSEKIYKPRDDSGSSGAEKTLDVFQDGSKEDRGDDENSKRTAEHRKALPVLRNTEEYINDATQGASGIDRQFHKGTKAVSDFYDYTRGGRSDGQMMNHGYGYQDNRESHRSRDSGSRQKGSKFHEGRDGYSGYSGRAYNRNDGQYYYRNYQRGHHSRQGEDRERRQPRDVQGVTRVEDTPESGMVMRGARGTDAVASETGTQDDEEADYLDSGWQISDVSYYEKSQGVDKIDNIEENLRKFKSGPVYSETELRRYYIGYDDPDDENWDDEIDPYHYERYKIRPEHRKDYDKQTVSRRKYYQDKEKERYEQLKAIEEEERRIMKERHCREVVEAGEEYSSQKKSVCHVDNSFPDKSVLDLYKEQAKEIYTSHNTQGNGNIQEDTTVEPKNKKAVLKPGTLKKLEEMNDYQAQEDANNRKYSLEPDCTKTVKSHRAGDAALNGKEKTRHVSHGLTSLKDMEEDADGFTETAHKHVTPPTLTIKTEQILKDNVTILPSVTSTNLSQLLNISSTSRKLEELEKDKCSALLNTNSVPLTLSNDSSLPVTVSDKTAEVEDALCESSHESFIKNFKKAPPLKFYKKQKVQRNYPFTSVQAVNGGRPLCMQAADSGRTLSMQAVDSARTLTTQEAGGVRSLSTQAAGNVRTLSTQAAGDGRTLSMQGVDSGRNFSTQAAGGVQTFTTQAAGDGKTLSMQAVDSGRNFTTQTTGSARTFTTQAAGDGRTLSMSAAGDGRTLSMSAAGDGRTLTMPAADIGRASSMPVSDVGGIHPANVAYTRNTEQVGGVAGSCEYSESMERHFSKPACSLPLTQPTSAMLNPYMPSNISDLSTALLNSYITSSLINANILTSYQASMGLNPGMNICGSYNGNVGDLDMRDLCAANIASRQNGVVFPSFSVHGRGGSNMQ